MENEDNARSAEEEGGIQAAHIVANAAPTGQHKIDGLSKSIAQ